MPHDSCVSRNILPMHIRALLVTFAIAAISATAPAPFEAILIGTGYPRPDPNRAGACTVVVAGDEWFVVDAGRAATLRIAATELKYDKLRAVFVTHLHSDHTSGLPDLFETSWQFGRKTRPFELYGPAGIEKLADAMLEFFAYDIHIRRDVQEKHPAAGATIVPHTIREGVVYTDANVRVTAFTVDHGAVKPAYGYRFESNGKTIVISGDTRPTPNLVKYAKGADVLILEAYLPEHFLRVDSLEVAKKLMSYHTSAEEAGTIASEAGVKTLAITHVIPGDADDTFRERIGKNFHGTLIIGHDLQVIESDQ